ncbi:MAG TPA: hypothetical protein VK824_11580 [Planctomycetota bacterium]|nr:hypothetical protein [Planctomycetota bacterium]
MGAPSQTAVPDAAPDRRASRRSLGVLLLVALLLVGESLLPGRLFLPLTPDDFPEWQAGRDPSTLQRHPHPDWSMSDVLHLLVPGLSVTAAAARDGRLPLWDDSQALGVPHLHEVHYGVLYPPAWLPLLLGLRGLAWLALLHLLAAGTGMLLYLAAIGRTRLAALTGALCFMGGAWITARLHSFPVVGAAVWLPWILLGLERGAQAATARERRRWRVLSAAALALSFLAGFPQVALLTLALATFVELARALAAIRTAPADRATPPRSPWGVLLAGGLALALGVALALPQLLPTLDYMRHDSARAEQPAAALAAEALEPPLLWQLLVPARYATPDLSGPHPLALRDLRAAQIPASINSAETAMGIGVSGLLLALLAIVYGRGWRTVAFSLVACLTLLLLCWPGLLVLAGQWIPLLRFGSPKRLLLVSSFALAVLAAAGLDLARTPRLAITVTAWALALLVTFLGLLARTTVPSAELPSDVDRWAAAIAESAGGGHTAAEVLAVVPPDNFRLAADAASRGALACLVVGVFCILFFRPRKRATVEGWSTAARTAPALLVGALALELCAGAWPALRAAPAEAVTQHAGDIGALARPQLATLAAATGADEPVPPRVLRFGNDPPWLRPNFPGLFGLADVQCYAPMAPRRLCELLDALEPGMVVSGSAIGGLLRPASLASPLLDLLGVRALLTGDAALAADGWREEGAVGGVRVLANTEALPRAFVATRAEVLPDAGARLARLTAAAFDPRATVVLEEPLAASLAASLSAAAGGGAIVPARGVRLISWRPGHARLAIASGEPGLLVVSESWHDGWRARLRPGSRGEADDAVGAWSPLGVLRADHALLALPLESRDDLVVEFDFAPPLVPFAMSLGALAGLLALALLLWPARGERAPALRDTGATTS